MHSCIYAGKVRHRRFAPVLNQFSYRIFQMYLDLSELPQLFDPYLFWSARRPALAWFRREDHLGPGNEPLDESVRNEVERQYGCRPNGPIRLLTHLRYFGIAMNPVSYYYCFDAQDQYVQFVLAEVHNTPWGERHCYVLPSPVRADSGSPAELWTAKTFHVSPFMPMTMQYRWLVSTPGSRLNIHLENHVLNAGDGSGAEQCGHRPEEYEPSATPQHTHPFDVTLSLKRIPLTRASLASILLNHPCMTLKVLSAIYWQAVRLWWKAVPFVPHPSRVVSVAGAGAAQPLE